MNKHRSSHLLATTARFLRAVFLLSGLALTPLAFPLWADRISHSVDTEDPAAVLARMLEELETAAR